MSSLEERRTRANISELQTMAENRSKDIYELTKIANHLSDELKKLEKRLAWAEQTIADMRDK